MHASVSLLVAAMLAASPLAAPTPELELRRADEQLAAGDFSGAAGALRELLRDPGLADESIREIFVRLGAIALYQGDADAAARAFERVLLADPDYQPNAGSPPQVRALFEEVRIGFHPVEVKLAAPSHAPAGKPIALTVTVRGAPTGAATRLFVRRGPSGAFHATPLAIDGGEARTTLPASPQAETLALFAAVVDAKGVRIAGDGSAAAPKLLQIEDAVPSAALVSPPGEAPSAWYASPWVWGGGAVVLVGGGVLTYFLATASPERASLPVRVFIQPTSLRP